MVQKWIFGRYLVGLINLSMFNFPIFSGSRTRDFHVSSILEPFSYTGTRTYYLLFDPFGHAYLSASSSNVKGGSFSSFGLLFVSSFFLALSKIAPPESFLSM